MSGRRSRLLLVVTGIAIAALGIGVFAGTRIQSPADAAADTAPPPAGDVTVPVESRVVNSEVVTRGDVTFAGSVDISPEVGGLSTPPIVTGQVPKAGSTIKEGTAILEIVGRPLIVLGGELPMYRSLRPGMSGPDVEQLEETLDRLGFDPGDVDGKYTVYTGKAVADLFAQVGYEPPAVDPEVEAELDAAEDAVDAAEDAVEDLEDAEDAENKDALDDAKEQLEDAIAERDEARAMAGTPLPAAEVVYVPSLPRRVDEVNVRRGGEVGEVAMSVSGADLQVKANVDDADEELLKEKMKVRIELPDGEEVPGTVTGIKAAKGEDGSGHVVTVVPGKLTAEQTEALRGANVRITIPIESTDGEVLAVPVAALTAGPGGQARVEVERDGRTELVEVDVGLTAQGYAEVTPVDGTLEAGEYVVVGAEGDDAAGG